MSYQLWRKPIMNTSLNITAFNYQNEIKMANTLLIKMKMRAKPFSKKHRLKIKAKRK